jgi:hypothetical protein
MSQVDFPSSDSRRPLASNLFIGWLGGTTQGGGKPEPRPRTLLHSKMRVMKKLFIPLLLILSLSLAAAAQELCTVDNAACMPGPKPTPTPINCDGHGGPCGGDPPPPMTTPKPPMSAQEFAVRALYYQKYAAEHILNPLARPAILSGFTVISADDAGSQSWRQLGLELDGSPADVTTLLPDSKAYYSLTTFTVGTMDGASHKAALFTGQNTISNEAVVLPVDPGVMPNAEIRMPALSSRSNHSGISGGPIGYGSVGGGIQHNDCFDPDYPCPGSGGDGDPTTSPGAEVWKQTMADNPLVWNMNDTFIDPLLYGLDPNNLDPGLSKGETPCWKCWQDQQHICEDTYDGYNNRLAAVNIFVGGACVFVGVTPGGQTVGVGCILGLSGAWSANFARSKTDLAACMARVQYACQSVCK